MENAAYLFKFILVASINMISLSAIEHLIAALPDLLEQEFEARRCIMTSVRHVISYTI